MTGSRIPAIDIGPFLAGTPAGKASVARTVATACEDLGFLLVSGHGLPQDLMDRAMAVSRAFFDLPTEKKMRSLPSRPSTPRGYSPPETKALAATMSAGVEAPPDTRELFMIGPIDGRGDRFKDLAGAEEMYRSNIWPEVPPDFRPALSELYQAMDALAAHLMSIFALGLDLPEDYFADKLDNPFSTLGSLHYPARVQPPLPGQLRAGAHTDFGSLTILHTQDAPGGLQVRSPDGDWLDVVPEPGQLVVNLGDMMARWTNDRWKSTLHRVVNPPRLLAPGSRRQSLAFFTHPNYDVEIACLETCQDPDDPPKYPPITSGQHIHEKMLRRVI